jgi:hypothetical protein
MWLLYALWRYRGEDPWRYTQGQGPPGPRYESMMAGFAVYAARIEEAGVKGLG